MEGEILLELPHMEFNNGNEQNQQYRESCFDVFAAAKAQQRVRDSIMEYGNENMAPSNLNSSTEKVGKSDQNACNSDSAKPILSSPSTYPTVKTIISTIEQSVNRGRSQSQCKRSISTTKEIISNWTARRAKSCIPSENDRGRTLESGPIGNTRNISKPQLSSEERELVEVREEIRIKEERMKRIQKHFERVKALGINTGHQPSIRSVKPLTIPSPPFSHVDQRKGKKGIAAETEQERDRAVTSQKPRPVVIPKGPTQSEPFHFRTDARAVAKSSEDVLVNKNSKSSLTVAELIQRFQRDPRSHDVPRGHSRLTQPVSPTLQTRIRSTQHASPPPRNSQDVKDEIDVEEMKFKFKARTVDQRIFQSAGELGVPKIPPKATTETRTIRLQTEERSELRKAKVVIPKETEGMKPFKARPVPASLYEARTVVPLTNSGNSNNNNSKPPLRGKPKVQSAAPVSADAAVPRDRRRSTSAPPARVLQPTVTVPPVARAQSPSPRPALTLTEPKEFNLRTNQRGLMHQATMAHRRKQEEDGIRMAREVSARPLPDLSRPFVPKILPKELTEFEEFTLVSVQRHRAASAAFLRELMVKEEDDKQSSFRARELPGTTYKPVVITHPEDRPPVVPTVVELASDSRAQRRKVFDDSVAVKKLQQIQERAAHERQQQLDEDDEIRLLRSKPVSEGGFTFKAAPVLMTDPFPVKAQPIMPLTEPMSPHLHTAARKRLQDRMES
eukprot:gene9729-20233_t